MAIPDYYDKTLPFASSGNKLEDDYRPAFEAWKADDSPANRRQLLTSVQPVLNTAASTYGGGTAIARSHAKMMALDAFRTYDPVRGSLKNHLLSELRRLQRTIPQVAQGVHVPEQVFLDKKRLQQAEDELSDDLGRPPSTAELANATGFSMKRISHIRNASSGVMSGTFTDESGETYMPASQIPGFNPAADAWQTLVYESLSPVDQSIMELSLGLHGSDVLENRQIAAKLGLSPGAISQRKAKIQQMLDSHHGDSLFGG